MSIKYLKNASSRTSLAYKMSVLDRLESIYLSKIMRFGPTYKNWITCINLIYFFLSWFSMVEIKLHCIS